MAQGNGVDLAAIFQLLTQVARTVSAHDRQFEAVDRRLGDITSDIAGLREAVTHYHATVLGHGVLISELDGGVRRIERHLRLEAARE